MATMISYLLMAVAPHFFAQAIVGVTGDDGECNGKAKVLVKVLGADGGNHVFVTADDGELAGHVGHNVVVAYAGDDLKDDGRSEKHRVEVRTIINGSDDEAASRGWLGVSLVNIQARADSQEEVGVVITNVVDDSPADQAGLQAKDVIVSIDGQAVGSNVSDLVKLVATNKPGDEIDVVVLRDGEEKAFAVTLGSRAASNKFEWKFNNAPLAEIEENIHTSAKFLHRDDDGEWIYKDLGDLSDLEGLPANIKLLMPQAGSHMTKIFVGDDGKRIQTTTSLDGVNISIEQEGDGPITVTRGDESGDETVETYADLEALQAADEEAAELFGDFGGHFEFKMDDLDLDDLHFDFNFDFDTENLPASINLWTQGMEGFEDAHEAFENAHLHIEEAMKQIEDSGALSEDELKSLPNMFKIRGMNGAPHLSRAKQSFEVRPNGMIEVKVRKGDSELIDLYENEDDLANRNPDLYEKYQDLRAESK